MDNIEQFRTAMAEKDIVTNTRIIVGGEKINRFYVEGDRRRTNNGWYILREVRGTLFAIFGTWKNPYEWFKWISNPLTEEEQKVFDEEIAQMRQQFERVREEYQQETSRKAQHILSISKSAYEEYGYLGLKKIKPYGLTIETIPEEAKRDLKKEERLLIPLRDIDGNIWNIQFISSNGQKWFLRKGRKLGCFFVLGNLYSRVIRIVEGFATGVSVYEALGDCVVVAFDCTNLLHVARLIKNKYRSAIIQIAGDNDQYRKDGNIGLEKAKEAADDIFCKYIVPDFSILDPETVKSNGLSDWNDLAQWCGIEEVKRQLDEPNEEWPEPEPIQNELSPVELLPNALIPKPYRNFIVDVTERMQCPIDFIAIPLITITSIIIGAGCGIKPKKNDDWTVIPNLWGCIVGRPGIMKTPAVAEPMQFLDKLQSESKNDYELEIKDYRTAMKVYESRKKVIDNEIYRSAEYELGLIKRKNDQPPLAIDVLQDLLSKLEEPPKSIWKRYKTNDVTIEKLNLLLSENPRGVLVFRDELIGLLRSFDKIGHESDRQFYLEAWSGTGSHTTDRIERGTIHTENLCLSLLGTTQPDKLLKYLYATFNGDNDGLLQRFQLIAYPDNPKEWKLIDKKPNREEKAKVFKILEQLSQMDFVSLGATKHEDDRFPYFVLDDEAQVINDQWITDLEINKLRNIDLHPLLIEHLSKFRSLMPSLALIFHLIELASNTKSKTSISEQNVAMACAWCDYLESHARRIYGLIIDANAQAASVLANKLKHSKLKNGFTWRDIQRKNWSFLNNKILAEDACEELVEKGWLKKSKNIQGKTTYLINPKLNKDGKNE